MDELVQIPSHNDERRAAMEVLAQFGAPAYLRRAKRVETVFPDLLDRLRPQRNKWLADVRLQLHLLLEIAGSLDTLRQLLAEDHLAVLRSWIADFGLAERPASGASDWRLRRALRDLAASIARFNRRWAEHVAKTDLSEVNNEREGYNRWYLLEKECAVGVIRSRQPFCPLEPMTHADVLTVLPPLPDIRLVG